MLPFVDEDRFVDAEQGIRVGAQRCQGVWVVEFKDTLYATACGLGLADCLGPFDRDGGHVGEDLVQGSTRALPYKTQDSYWSKRMTSTSQNAEPWRVGTTGGDPRPPRRCGFRNTAAPSVSNGYNPMKVAVLERLSLGDAEGQARDLLDERGIQIGATE